MQWLIDPLDGTTNFVHHRSDYAVSIAMIADDGTELAAVGPPTRRRPLTRCLAIRRERNAFAPCRKACRCV